MNLRLQNQLNMVGACFTVAQSSDYKPAWSGKQPADFGTDLTQLQTDYGAVTVKAAQADGAIRPARCEHLGAGRDQESRQIFPRSLALARSAHRTAVVEIIDSATARRSPLAQRDAIKSG